MGTWALAHLGREIRWSVSVSEKNLVTTDWTSDYWLTTQNICKLFKRNVQRSRMPTGGDYPIIQFKFFLNYVFQKLPPSPIFGLYGFSRLISRDPF